MVNVLVEVVDETTTRGSDSVTGEPFRNHRNETGSEPPTVAENDAASPAQRTSGLGWLVTIGKVSAKE
jgi:hypothetical protein